jgi:hypothetical protein
MQPAIGKENFLLRTHEIACVPASPVVARSFVPLSKL